MITRKIINWWISLIRATLVTFKSLQIQNTMIRDHECFKTKIFLIIKFKKKGMTNGLSNRPDQHELRCSTINNPKYYYKTSSLRGSIMILQTMDKDNLKASFKLFAKGEEEQDLRVKTFTQRAYSKGRFSLNVQLSAT